MLFGWIPFTIFLFFRFSPPIAILSSVVGGILFLPMAVYDFPGIPSYGKYTAIALGLLFGEILSNQKKIYTLKLKIYDLPMILWCFIVPFVTSISNNLGLRDALSSTLSNYLIWGVVYWAGRRYFSSESALRNISIAIIVGGLLYVPLILFELRMSPQLSNIIYGFSPHSFEQHIRYGGYRPLVFMQHGLKISLWMAASFSVSFWLWKSKEVTHFKNISLFYIVYLLLVVAVLCKSANGWFSILLSLLAWFVYSKFETTKHLRIFIAIIPLYIFFRATNILPIRTIELYFSYIFDPERMHSLLFRLNQEDLFSVKVMDRFLFGWGGFGRGKPIDPLTGNPIKIVDSLWIIIYSENGIVGLISFLASMLLGPWLIFKNNGLFFISANEKKVKYSIDSLVISLVVVLFIVDCLLNGMVNPVYTLCAGALVSYYIEIKENNLTPSNTNSTIERIQ